MKNFYKLPVFLCFIVSLSTFGQIAKQDSIKNDTLRSSNIASPQPITEKFIQPSPDAASLGRYGEYEVDLSNGLIPIEIPIYTVESGNLKLPVALTYHAGGIKVNDVSSTVGIGWSLQSAGVITRSMVSRPDESNNGYLNMTFPAINTETVSNFDFLCFLGRLAGNDGFSMDGSPDGFFYNYEGKSGRFLFARRDRNGNDIAPILITIPYRPIKIEYYIPPTLDKITSFVITETDGTKYYFGTVAGSSKTYVENTVQGVLSYNSSWYLNKIESALSVDVIEINYTSPVAIKHKSIYPTSLTKTQKSSLLPPTFKYNRPVTETYVNAIYPTEIIFKNGKVTFDYVNDRLDLTRNDNTPADRLDKINIYQKTDAVLTRIPYTKLRHFQLNQSYFNTGDGYSLSDAILNNIHDANTSPLRKILKLNGVTQFNPSGESLPSYEIYYHENSPLPIFGGLNQDYWGYFNGKYNIKSLLTYDINTPANYDPNDFYSGGGYSLSTANGADRTPDFDYAVIGTIKELIYPTGGKSKFIFEANQTNLGAVGAGIRIKAIENYDDKNAVNFVTKKVYQYNDSYFVNPSPNSNLAVAGYVYKSVSAQSNVDEQGNPGSPQCYDNVQNESITENMSFMLGSGTSNIAYTEVEVKQVDASNNTNGKTVRTFVGQPDGYEALTQIKPNLNIGNFFGNPFYALPAITKAWQRGQLLTEKIYTSGNVLLKETINSYQDFFPNYKSFGYTSRILFQPDIAGAALCGSYYSASMLDGTCSGGFGFELSSVDHIYEYKRIETEIGYRQLMSTIVKDYNQDGLYPLITTNNFTYSPNHNRQHLLTKTMNDSKGQNVVENYEYPNDFTGSVYTTMVNRNIISPVIHETMSRAGTLISESKKNYGIFGSYTLPSSEESKVETGPWITSVTYDGYDTRGNLMALSTRSGQKLSLEWYALSDYGKTDNLKTYTLGGGGTGTVLQRSMSYDYLPLIGLSSSTDINGYTTTHQYDSFNRLFSTKDPDGNLLRDLYYHYANQDDDIDVGMNPTNALNYIISRTAREAQTGSVLSNSVDNTTTQIQYMDGLGRSLQAQVWQGTPDKTKDLITQTSQYDVYGRGNKDILSTPSDGSTGTFKSNAESLASAFYGGDTYPFTETKFEPSPLNRPEQLFGAGQAWRVLNNEKFVKSEYQIAGDGVIKFELQSNGTVNCGSNYGGSTLYSNVTTSERGFLTYEVKDNEGRVTHKLQQLNKDSLAITAYCYDIRGNLAVVIPPEAYRKLGSGLITSFQESDEIFKELMFGYHFDTQNRQIEKHVPGGGWRYSVFNKNDFEVAFADEEDQAKDYWLFRKFDALGKIVQTGLLNGKGSKTRTELQTAFDEHDGLTYETIGTGLYGYTNVSFPTGYVPVEADIMSVSYFDDYAWQTESAYNFDPSTAFHGQGLTKGLMTGMLSRNIETNAWLKSVNYYDYRRKLIQSFFKNHKGNIERSETQYRFNGEVLKMRIDHEGINEIYEYEYNHLGNKKSFRHTKNGTVKNVSKYEYDEINRLITKKLGSSELINSVASGSWNNTNIWQNSLLPTINDVIRINAGHTVTINSGEAGSAGGLFNAGTLNTYGQLKLGVLPENSVANDLQTVDYTYHIRGLRGINLDGNNNLTNKLFSMRLDYETAGFYDGNIGKQEWKSNIDNVTRSFTYGYDGASRIKTGIYGSTKAGENYTLNNVTYDFNGNITNLSKNGWKSNNTFGLVDNLNYTYQSNSNKIQKVDDASNEIASFADVSGNDYTYSLDGSLTSDANKGISVIEYNYLKLPRRIVKAGVEILYQYDATGRKLKEIIGSNYTDYFGNIIKKNDVLYQISHDEGRIIDGQYEYNIKDHLGNLRVAFRDSLGFAKITQANSYGIFGENLTTLSYLKQSWKGDKFKFTGKEELSETDYTDFGARLYDNLVPRFITIDPLAEIARRFSPYTYANDNPVRFIDPDGMATDDGDTYTTKDNNGNDVYNDVNSQKVVGYGGKSGAVDDDKDKGKKITQKNEASKVTNGEIPLEKLNPFAMAKLGKAQRIKTSYTSDEIGTIISIGASFGLEFIGAGELLLGWGARLLGRSSPVAVEQVLTNGVRMSVESSEGLIGGSFSYTNGQTVEFLANKTVNGNTLELTEMIFYPKGVAGNELKNVFGSKMMGQTLETIKQYAKEQGFSSLRIQFQRAANSSSANPGKVVDKIFNLK